MAEGHKKIQTRSNKSSSKGDRTEDPGDSIKGDVSDLEAEFSQAFAESDPRLNALEKKLAEAREKIKELKKVPPEVVADLQMQMQKKLMENEQLKTLNVDLQRVIDEIRPKLRQSEIARQTSEKVVARLTETDKQMEIEVHGARKAVRVLEAKEIELQRSLKQAEQKIEQLMRKFSGGKKR